jgi:hypothetical protein
MACYRDGFTFFFLLPYIIPWVSQEPMYPEAHMHHTHFAACTFKMVATLPNPWGAKNQESPLKVNHGDSLKSVTAPKSQM